MVLVEFTGKQVSRKSPRKPHQVLAAWDAAQITGHLLQRFQGFVHARTRPSSGVCQYEIQVALNRVFAGACLAHLLQRLILLVRITFRSERGQLLASLFVFQRSNQWSRVRVEVLKHAQLSAEREDRDASPLGKRLEITNHSASYKRLVRD